MDNMDNNYSAVPTPSALAREQALDFFLSHAVEVVRD
jgi:hypothetical protein